jgi:hypothetical protein
MSNKLIAYLKNNPDIFEIVFFGHLTESFTVEPKYACFNYHDLIKNTHWLYEEVTNNNKPIGVIESDRVVTIDENGIYTQHCIGLQNLPYVLYSSALDGDGNDFHIDEYALDRYGHGYKTLLHKYEKWCESNDIKIEKNCTSEYNTYIAFGLKPRTFDPFYIPTNELQFDREEKELDILVNTLQEIVHSKV